MYIFETNDFFFWQDTNLLLIQNTYHHQMAVVPWESRYNSETTLTLISVCLLFTLFPTHFYWNEWEFIQQSRHFLIGSKCLCFQPPTPKWPPRLLQLKTWNISNSLSTGSELEPGKKMASKESWVWPPIFHPTPLVLGACSQATVNWLDFLSYLCISDCKI